MPREGFAVEFTNTASNRVRHRFEPRAAGGWTRHEEHYDSHEGGSWRPVGKEIVADVVLQADADCEALAVIDHV